MNWTARVSQAILEPGGEELLRLLHALYARVDLPGDAGPTAGPVDALTDLGLARVEGGRVELTDTGYLAGNVAKEYCVWRDGGRRVPPPAPPAALVAGKDVLDLGCSYGRWLWEFQKTARSAIGIEMQPEYIALGTALARLEGIEPPRIECGSAEDVHLFVPPASVDFVFARLVFNHIDIHRTLERIHTVLRPGGVVWLQVEPLRVAMRRLLHGRRLRTKCFDLFAVVNSLTFMTIGRQMRLRARGRMHTVHKPCYPRVSQWHKSLQSAGFEGFTLVAPFPRPTFWARKPPANDPQR